MSIKESFNDILLEIDRDKKYFFLPKNKFLFLYFLLYNITKYKI